jgi:endonuclease/exonuclease/phosphatase (EEP) superfamily protein YafD
MQSNPTSLIRRFLFKSADLLNCLAALVVIILIVSTLFGRYPFFELTVHFRIQYAIGAFICLILLAAFRRWKFGLLLLICAVFNIVQITPYYLGSPHRVGDGETQKLRLMTANVAMRNESYLAFRQSVEVAAPDILVLQEVTEDWNREIQPLLAVYPYSKIVPKQGGAGLALFSRYPLESTKVLFEESSMHPALVAAVNFYNTRLTVLLMHPLTPMRPDKFANRNEQLKQAAVLMKSLPEPKLLVGDLNTTMWSPYYQDLIKESGLYDTRIGRGLYPTFESDLPQFLGIPIDHLLISETIEIENFSFGDPTGSDHRPLVFDLKIIKSTQ